MLISLFLSLVPQATPPLQDWTILVYGAVDNSSEESFVPDMHFLMQGLDSPGIDVLAFVDRSPDFSDDEIGLGEDFADSRLYRLSSDGPVRLGGGEQFPEITRESVFEANSGDVATLRKALRWAKATSPAKNYAVVFYSHGDGRGMCPDNSSDEDELRAAEISNGLTFEDSVDLMVFDVCLMGGIENAYQWRSRPGAFGADIMVATPMAGMPIPWGSIFGSIARSNVDTAKMDAKQFGEMIVSESEQERLMMLAEDDLPDDYRRILRGESMACLDLTKAESAKLALDELARELGSWSASKAKVEQIRSSKGKPNSMHYMGDDLAYAWRAYPYFDLYDLARRIRLLPTATSALKAAASAVQEKVEALIISSFGMVAFDEYGGFESGQNGLFVMFPEGDSFPSGDPQAAYGMFASSSEGAVKSGVGNWYQLLQSWYATTKSDE